MAGVTVDEAANIARGQIMKGLYFMLTTRQMAQERYEKKASPKAFVRNEVEKIV